MQNEKSPLPDKSPKNLLDEEGLSDEWLVAKGWVERVEGSIAWVTTERKSGCSGCSSEKGCGTSALSQLFAPRSKTPIQVENDLGAQVGDEVQLCIKQSHLMQHSLMGYGVPLLGMFLLAILLQWMATITSYQAYADVAAILGGGFGLWFGWWLTRQVYTPERPKLDRILS